MENGDTIDLESAWALNTLEVRETRYQLCGTKEGLDTFTGGVRINGVECGRQYEKNPNLNAGGVAFYDGNGNVSPATREAIAWVHAILEDKDPVVLPEQALVVTQILEGIYESAKTGKPYYFN